jgi:hypothetical protein
LKLLYLKGFIRLLTDMVLPNNNNNSFIKEFFIK